MRMHTLVLVLTMSIAKIAAGTPITFENDYPAFAAAAGPLSMIDFETLPDGRPSAGNGGTFITETFNYDEEGAHFSAQFRPPVIGGNPTSGFSLEADNPGFQRTWITAQLTVPIDAVGIFFPGGTTLFAFDSAGNEIARVEYSAPFSGHFLGIISPDVLIASVRVDRGNNAETIDSFLFHPVPEPVTASLVLVGAAVARRSARRRY